MTIEIASPAEHMDQSDMLSLISGLYDKLVSDVAAKVLGQLDASIAAHVAHAVASIDLTHQMEEWADNYLDDRLDTWATVHLDVNEEIDRYVRNELDIADLVKDAVQDLTFEVTVS